VEQKEVVNSKSSCKQKRGPCPLSVFSVTFFFGFSTLGIFPIIMNMIQFWIIDSIVKASGVQGVSLDHEATDPLDHADREPLFHASDDDDDDNEGTATRYDIENPPTQDHPSRSPPPRRRDSHPSHPSGAPPTHKKGPSSGSMELHEYPPSLTHSLDSASTSSSSPKVATKLNNYKPKRRGPPSPISVPPNQAIAVASNSPWQTTPAAIQAPTPSQVTKSSTLATEPDPTTQDGWDNWGDDDDDWGERVGEEDWTGRRAAEAKEGVEEIWRTEPISS
jgi:hypothetical protein